MSQAPEVFDAVVVGCGPGGATAAYHLAAAGLRVLALEREAFPRYHIGESLTGVAAALLDGMGLKGEMDRRGFPAKSGVKVVGTQAKNEFFVRSIIPTWQVRRDEFDAMVLERAVAVGVEHRFGSVKTVLREGDQVVGVRYRPRDDDSGVLKEVRARVVIDASGHSAFLSKQGVAGPRQVDAFGYQIAVFTQFVGARRDPGPMGNNTVILYAKKHHWAWFIPLSDDVVSVGVVVPTSTFKEKAKSPSGWMHWAVQNLHPELTRRLGAAKAVEDVRTVRNYSYRLEPFAGPGWLAVGDAHRFADPIFSFGVAFAMCEGVAAAKATLEACATGSFERPMANYAAYCNRGHEAAYDLIRYFWRFPAFFAFQVRGEFEHDMMRLFSGDLFDVDELPALAAMRRSLHQHEVRGVGDRRAKELAARIHGLYSDFQGIEGAFLDIVDGALAVSFVLADDRLELYEHMYQIEASIYREFGKDSVSVRAYARRERDGAEELQLIRQVGRRGLAVGLADSRAIFDHRRTA